MKRIFFSLLLVFGILSAFAQNQFVVDGLMYTILDKYKHTCEISGFATSQMTTKVEIPESVTYKDVEYTVTEIGRMAFYETPVETVTIPYSVINIGHNAFYGSRLKTVTIPKTVINIDSESFGGCPLLENILVEEENVNYSSVDGVLYNKSKDILMQCPGARKEMVFPDGVYIINYGAFIGCSSITSITLPETIIEIGNYAFSFCTSLNSIDIPDGIKKIGMYTFYDCESLHSIKLPSKLIGIDQSAFTSCTSLTSIVLPENVSYLEATVFNLCSSLNTVICMSDKFVQIFDRTFYGLPEDAKLYVKADLIEVYKNSDWAQYFSEILPIEDRPETGAVEEIEIDNSLPFDVYGLSGILVMKNAGKENLKEIPAGIYILRQGNASKKIILR